MFVCNVNAELKCTSCWTLKKAEKIRVSNYENPSSTAELLEPSP